VQPDRLPQRRARRSVQRSQVRSSRHRSIPAGYQFGICPPTAFNLIGLLFHREWSETATLELSAHFDDRGNAIGLTVGSNQAGDFSYVRLDSDTDLTRLGFRVALLPSEASANWFMMFPCLVGGLFSVR